MGIETKLEIDFHQQDEVSITIENTAKGREEKFSEILLFCCFTLRTLSNLGNQPYTKSLAMSLVNIHNKDSVEYNNSNEIKLIDYPGHQASKRFILELILNDEYFNFTYQLKGFGFFAVGIDFYPPVAILLLFRFLSKKYIRDEEFMTGLRMAAVTCGTMCIDNKISLSNQREMALTIADTCYQKDVDGDKHNNSSSNEKITLWDKLQEVLFSKDKEKQQYTYDNLSSAEVKILINVISETNFDKYLNRHKEKFKNLAHKETNCLKESFRIALDGGYHIWVAEQLLKYDLKKTKKIQYSKLTSEFYEELKRGGDIIETLPHEVSVVVLKFSEFIMDRLKKEFTLKTDLLNTIKNEIEEEIKVLIIWGYIAGLVEDKYRYRS